MTWPDFTRADRGYGQPARVVVRYEYPGGEWQQVTVLNPKGTALDVEYDGPELDMAGGLPVLIPPKASPGRLRLFTEAWPERSATGAAYRVDFGPHGQAALDEARAARERLRAHHEEWSAGRYSHPGESRGGGEDDEISEET